MAYLPPVVLLWSMSAVTAVAQNTNGLSDGGMGDIVVTAQRREERIQDVPISVVALTSTSLRNAGVTSTNDLSIAVPGLELGRQNGSISPFIRGIGNRSTAPGEESAVPLYIDGVYVPTLTAGLMSLENVERVEVLRGPQGTLFGRNATAGVIQIITRDPGDKTRFDARVGYANYDTVEGSAYLGGALTSRIRADVSGYYMHQGDGWGKNVTTGNDAFKGFEHAFRGKLIFDVGDDTEIRIGADYSKARTNTPPLYTPLPGKVLTSGAPFFAPGTPYLGFYTVAENRDVSVTTRQWGANLQLRHSFGAIDLVSITSYRDVASRWILDQDGTPVNAVSAVLSEPAKTWTQELQLLSNTDGPLQWIFGAYYFDNRAKEDPLSLSGSNPPFSVFTIDRFVQIGAKSLAGFAQGTYDFEQGTKLTVGLRYTHDKRTIAGYDLRNGVLFAPSVSNQSATFGKLTWRGSLDHRFSDSLLAYATVSRGFKSGVFSAVAYLDPAVRPETLDTYEIGFKSDLLDRRLRFNGAAFYNNFKDVQVQSQVVGGIKLNNAAKARSYGFEVELQAEPTRGLTFAAALAYLDGEYLSYPGASFYTRTPTATIAATTGDATGRETIYTPHLTASVTGSYVIDNVTLNASYNYNSGFYFDVQNATRQPNYGLFNASIAYLSDNQRWGVRLWAKNLTAEHYYTAIVSQSYGDTATPAAPRTYGLSLETHF